MTSDLHYMISPLRGGPALIRRSLRANLNTPLDYRRPVLIPPAITTSAQVLVIHKNTYTLVWKYQHRLHEMCNFGKFYPNNTGQIIK